MVKASKSMQMETNIMEIGKIILDMVKVNKLLKMERSMLENLMIIK